MATREGIDRAMVIRMGWRAREVRARGVKARTRVFEIVRTRHARPIGESGKSGGIGRSLSSSDRSDKLL